MKNQSNHEEIILAAGCFWGVQHLLNDMEGVVGSEVGYIGGHVNSPTYEQVCSGTTGHLEAVKILFDPSKTSFEAIAKMFFEIHDATQADGQGPDIGEQYKSAVFYYNDQQKQIAQRLIDQLTKQGLNIATELRAAAVFWRAEDFHQDYYKKTGKQPYCHVRKKLF